MFFKHTMKQRLHTTYEARGLFHAKALNHTSRIYLVETKKKSRATNWTTAGHPNAVQLWAGHAI